MIQIKERNIWIFTEFTQPNTKPKFGATQLVLDANIIKAITLVQDKYPFDQFSITAAETVNKKHPIKFLVINKVTAALIGDIVYWPAEEKKEDKKEEEKK